MNKMLLGLLIGSTTLFACAEDAQPEKQAADDEVSVGVAFYGLTVMDCQAQATQCYQEESKRLFSFLRKPLNCSVKLSTCLAEAATEAAANAVEDTLEVAQCGSDGLTCFSDSGSVKDVLACQGSVEGCVVGKVEEMTGIPLPTSQEIVEAGLDVAEEVVETGVHVAGEVIETAGEVVEEAVETTGEIVEEAVETTGQVVETAVDTAETVVSETVETATEIVEPVVEKVDGALVCAEESRECWRTTRKFFSCQLAYNQCLRDL